MGDTKIVYDEKFGIAIFKREICAELGETFWNEFLKKVRLMESEKERTMGLRQLVVDNYSVFYVIENERVIVMRVLYSASDIGIRLKG